MIDKKISIIIPIYNAEQHLNKCIESVVNQSYSNLEIILINDGSTDSSIDICEKWHKQDSRIKLIDKKNEGVSIARNKGLSISTGELIGFVDSDDYIEHNMYELMKRDMDNYGVDIVMCNSFSITSDGNKKRGYNSYDSFKVETKELTKRFINFEKIFYSSVWSKLYKREIIDGIEFDNNIALGEDYFFNGLAYKKALAFYYESKPLYNYNIREESISRNRIDSHFFDKYSVAKMLADEYSQLNHLNDNDLYHITFSASYEILYELYEQHYSKDLRKKWRTVFKKESKKFKSSRIKSKFKIFCMKYAPLLYVRITKKYS